MKEAYIPRDEKDTGYLVLTNTSTILSNGTLWFNLDERFIPYDDLRIVNLNSNSDVEVTINQHSIQILPKGNSLQINQKVRDIRIKNIGSSTIAINEVRLWYRNSGYIGQNRKEFLITALKTGWGLFR